MSRSWLTIRARLTLLYSVMFAACGGTLAAITYTLVARLPEGSPTGNDGSNRMPPDFLERCRREMQVSGEDADFRIKCLRVYDEGVLAGARIQHDATLDHLLRYSLIALTTATVLAAVAGWFVAGRVLGRVHHITATARTASRFDLSARVAATGPRDELRELADTFDDMLARLQAAFASQRRFIADAGHELRTPLAVMRTTVDVVLAKPTASHAELTAMGRDVRAAVGAAEDLIDALLTLARNERGLTVREDVDLATVAEDVLDADRQGPPRPEAVLASATVAGDAVLLERLVANLVDNAVRYNVPDGHVRLTTGLTSDRAWATVTVTNTGPVVPPHLVGTLFEPFRRLDDRVGSTGFGLGLAIVASIAAIHHGTVEAHPRPGGGLIVVVRLPAVKIQDPSRTTASR
ncbi:sensor histidine kinase [Uniformispora flossi]|uniref:sensor histidine kinase n=1 Tax=Uniformispora flossi TaxID=3390723 RepID=UPI003C2C9DC3